MTPILLAARPTLRAVEVRLAPDTYSTPRPDLRDFLHVWAASWSEASCAQEPEESWEAFFYESSGLSARPAVDNAAHLRAMLVCEGCPVRRRCLEAALQEFPSVQYREGGRVRVVTSLPTMGTWGGTVLSDRWPLRHRDPVEAAAELEATFDERLEDRIRAWITKVRRGRPLTHHDRDVLRKLRARGTPMPGIEERAKPRIRRLKLFTTGGRPGPGRGKRSRIGRYAAAHGISYATAWRRLRAS